MQNLSDFRSILQIIEEQAKDGYPAHKNIYKLKLLSNMGIEEIPEAARGIKQFKYHEDPEKQIENIFFGSKVKQRHYKGIPTIAIYFNNVTKKIMQKLQNL